MHRVSKYIEINGQAYWTRGGCMQQMVRNLAMNPTMHCNHTYPDVEKFFFL